MMIVALSAGFASCSDDDETDFDAANLVGTWEATYSEGWEKDTDYPEDDATWNGTWDKIEDNSEMSSRMQFNADGTGADIYEHDDDDNFTWNLKGTQLSRTYLEYGTMAVKVLELTETKAVVEFSYKEKEFDHYEKTTYTKVK